MAEELVECTKPDLDPNWFKGYQQTTKQAKSQM